MVAPDSIPAIPRLGGTNREHRRIDVKLESIRRAPFVPRNVAARECDTLEWPGSAKPATEGGSDALVESIGQCAAAHPPECLGVVAGLFARIDVAAAEADRLVRGHDG